MVTHPRRGVLSAESGLVRSLALRVVSLGVVSWKFTIIRRYLMTCSVFTFARYRQVRLVRLKGFAHSYFVSCKHTNQILLIVLQVLDMELLCVSGYAANFHPHRSFQVPNGYIVALQWCTSIGLGNTPLNDRRIFSRGPNLQRTRGWGWHSFKEKVYSLTYKQTLSRLHQGTYWHSHSG